MNESTVEYLVLALVGFTIGATIVNVFYAPQMSEAENRVNRAQVEFDIALERTRLTRPAGASNPFFIGRPA